MGNNFARDNFSASDLDSDRENGKSTSSHCDRGSDHELAEKTSATSVQHTGEANDSRTAKKTTKQAKSGPMKDLSAEQATKKPRGKTSTKGIQTQAVEKLQISQQLSSTAPSIPDRCQQSAAQNSSKKWRKAEMKKATDMQDDGRSSFQCLAANENTEETRQGTCSSHCESIKSEKWHLNKTELQEEATTFQRKKKKKKKKKGIQVENDTAADHGQVAALLTSQPGQPKGVGLALQGEGSYHDVDKEYRPSHCDTHATKAANTEGKTTREIKGTAVLHMTAKNPPGKDNHSEKHKEHKGKKYPLAPNVENTPSEDTDLTLQRAHQTPSSLSELGEQAEIVDEAPRKAPPEEGSVALPRNVAFTEERKEDRASRITVTEFKKAGYERDEEYSQLHKASTLPPINNNNKKTGKQIEKDTGNVSSSTYSSQPRIATGASEAKTTGKVCVTCSGIARSTPEEGKHSENPPNTLMDAEKKCPLTTLEDVGTPSDNIPDRCSSSVVALDETNIAEDKTSGKALQVEGCVSLPHSIESEEPPRPSTEDRKQEWMSLNVTSGADSKITECETDCNGQYGEELKKFTEDDSFSETDEEKKNILKIFKLMYGVGLRTLRKLFLDVHLAWTNQPKDAAGLDRGKMKLLGHENNTFQTGNIDEWDFSLMTKVLLFSKKCSHEISKKTGYVKALETLRDYRNKLIGHPSTDEMSTDDFKINWTFMSSALQTLGADSDEIQDILTDEVLVAGKHYRSMFLSELANSSRQEQKLDEISKKLDKIIDARDCDLSKQLPQPNEGGRNWDEWMKFCRSVYDFDFYQNQYILVTDALPKENVEQFSVLRSIPWKMVLDLDHKSEERGFYREFTSKENQSNLISMLTPAELRKCTSASLPRQIDGNQTQWLFVNGRENDTDGGPQTFPEWEATSVKHISRLFSCCSDPDKFDKLKPVVCVLLPFRSESWPFLEVTLHRLKENFDEFNMTFVTVCHDNCHLVPPSFGLQIHDLSPDLLVLGVSNLLNLSTSQEYRMPTSQAEVPAKLKKSQYLYLEEYMEVLYDGCEDIPQELDDQSKLDDFFDQHRKSFMSGNWISFTSLYCNHDARRQIGDEVRTHIQRLLDQGFTHSTIVEIRHSPGTGGTTIARRVLWDLHKFYPCAVARLDSCRTHDGDDTWVHNLANRIASLAEICHTPPVILMDGGHVRTESLTNKLVRALNNMGKRALLLRCQHGSKISETQYQSQGYHVHKVFNVNVKLQDSTSDLVEFKSKYKEYIVNLSTNPCRVFHFPLMAMIEDFHPKLKEIVHSTFDEMKGLDQEVAVVVAFIQKYANQATPALLLYEAFKQMVRKPSEVKRESYHSIKGWFSQHLLNLMVPANPSKRLSISTLRELPPESYTLQHPVVAEMVLRKFYDDQLQDLFSLTRRFLQLPIFQEESLLAVIEDLFIHNRYGETKTKFSVLFMEMQKSNPDGAAEIFCEAAERTKDPVVFAHAARFHAKKSSPSFPMAKKLIDTALSKARWKKLLDTKGVILHLEMKHKIKQGKVKNLQILEDMATECLRFFREARTFPPTYPNPLVGEVWVWVTCIEWITRNMCGGDSDQTLKFITGMAPPFFRTCVGDSFYLLDIIDGIVYSVSNLQDAEETRRLANNARLSLMTTFNKPRHMGKGRKDTENVIQACKSLCSVQNFPKLSVRELKRIQAQYILNSQDQIETITPKALQYLLQLLEDLVKTEGEHKMAYHLMKICTFATVSPPYSLEQGLHITDLWLSASDHNCLPYFYQMEICFLKILNGNTMEYRARYQKALKNCKEKSKDHCRRTMSTHFVGKEGDGMSRLVSRSALFQGVDYTTENSEKVVKFWTVDSRQKLLECKGRVRPRTGVPGGERTYIELTQGNVELYVAKNNNIGKAGRDYTPGSLVYFVVSFNLHGPVANGITFTPSEQEVSS